MREIEVNGMKAWTDLSDKSEEEIAHLAIDCFITLADRSGRTIGEELLDCMIGYSHSVAGERELRINVTEVELEPDAGIVV